MDDGYYRMKLERVRVYNASYGCGKDCWFLVNVTLSAAVGGVREKISGKIHGPKVSQMVEMILKKKIRCEKDIYECNNEECVVRISNGWISEFLDASEFGD